jgi:hypothetical protein
MNRQLIWSFLAIGFAVWGICYTGYCVVDKVALRAPMLVTIVVVLALAFDFTNGIHDAANSIATVVSTRVLSPLQAVVWAAFFNFVAAYVFGTHVAMTIGTGVVHADVVDTLMILSGLLGAILWNLTTWYLGLPTSSSHALIGALAGAGGPGCSHRQRAAEDCRLHYSLAYDRTSAGLRDGRRHDLALPKCDAAASRFPVQEGATSLRGPVQPRTWQQ